MPRFALALSVGFNLIFAASLLYLLSYNPDVAVLQAPSGAALTLTAQTVKKELIKRHAEEVASDLLGRSLIQLACQEGHISLDKVEFQARWQRWLTEPGTQARLDGGEITEAELQSQLTTLVLLDELTWQRLGASQSDVLLQSTFKKNKSRYEEIRLRHIVVDSRLAALDAIDRLVAGVEFSKLAQRVSLDPLTREQGGDLGWKTRADLTEDLRALLFTLRPGAISSPVASPSGWHIFLIDDRHDTYAECLPLVRRDLTAAQRPETLAELRKRFQVDRLQGESLSKSLNWPPRLFSDSAPLESLVVKSSSTPSPPGIERAP